MFTLHWSHTTPSSCNCSVPVHWWFKSQPRKSLVTCFSKVGIYPTKVSSNFPAGCVEFWVQLKNFYVITFSTSIFSFSVCVFWFFWTFRNLDLKVSPAKIFNVAEKAPKPGDRFPLIVVSLCLSHCKTNLSISETDFSFSLLSRIWYLLQINLSDKPTVLH